MAYVLRKYQDEAVSEILNFFRSQSKHRPIEVAPTGSGKSVIIAHVAKQLKDEVLVFQPSLELLEQNFRKYDEEIKLHPELERASIFSASADRKEKGRVTFATIGSVIKCPELFSEVKYVIIDECHRVPAKETSMYRQFFSKINAKFIGLTATPFHLKSYVDYMTAQRYSQINLLTRERPKFFNKFLHVVQIKDMYADGHLCPLSYIQMNFDGTFLKFNTTGAEYTDESMQESMSRNKIIEKLPDIIGQAFKKGRKSCLVFVRTVDEARRLAEMTPFSDYVHAKTSKIERRAIISRFKAGSIKTLFNVSVLTTGFDYPALDVIILARPTASLILYMQMIGRGIRNADGKENCAVLDMCGNFKKFGKIEDMVLVDDPIRGWVLRNNERVLSGRPMNEVLS